jgi:hypothetical protein
MGCDEVDLIYVYRSGFVLEVKLNKKSNNISGSQKKASNFLAIRLTVRSLKQTVHCVVTK